jgi:uncharacterized tellurite resistance protein B-like protein
VSGLFSELTDEETAVGLCACIAFSDGSVSEEEAELMRKYFLLKDIKSFEARLNKFGYEFPAGLPDATETIHKRFQACDEQIQLRALALSLLLIEADGVVSQSELESLRVALSLTKVDSDAVTAFLRNELHEVID